MCSFYFSILHHYMGITRKKSNADFLINFSKKSQQKRFFADKKSKNLKFLHFFRLYCLRLEIYSNFRDKISFFYVFCHRNPTSES